jgi:hypothetical protein
VGGALSAAGYQVYAINPLAVARYRDPNPISGDAKLLADLVRTDRHNHRAIAGDSADAKAIKVLARAHQNLIWARTLHTNVLRSALREYNPAALVAFEDLAHGDAVGVLGRAPAPSKRPPEPDRDPDRAQTWWPATQHRRPRPRNPDRCTVRTAGRPRSSAAVATTPGVTLQRSSLRRRCDSQRRNRQAQ